MPELRVRRDGREADQGRGSDAQVPEVRTRSHAGGSHAGGVGRDLTATVVGGGLAGSEAAWALAERGVAVTLYEMRPALGERDRKSTRLNSSHRTISYAVFCLKKKKQRRDVTEMNKR